MPDEEPDSPGSVPEDEPEPSESVEEEDPEPSELAPDDEPEFSGSLDDEEPEPSEPVVDDEPELVLSPEDVDDEPEAGSSAHEVADARQNAHRMLQSSTTSKASMPLLARAVLVTPPLFKRILLPMPSVFHFP